MNEEVKNKLESNRLYLSFIADRKQSAYTRIILGVVIIFYGFILNTVSDFNIYTLIAFCLIVSLSITYLTFSTLKLNSEEIEMVELGMIDEEHWDRRNRRIYNVKVRDKIYKGAYPVNEFMNVNVGDKVIITKLRKDKSFYITYVK